MFPSLRQRLAILESARAKDGLIVHKSESLQRQRAIGSALDVGIIKIAREGSSFIVVTVTTKGRRLWAREVGPQCK